MGVLKLFRVEGGETTGFDHIFASKLFANSVNKGILQIVIRRKNHITLAWKVGVTLILSIEKSMFINLFSYQRNMAK